MRKLIPIIFIILIQLFSCSNRDEPADKTKLLGNDYRLFQSTPAWELAKAVWDEDIDLIKKIGKEAELLNYQEGKFGKTLLMMSISNQQFNSFKTLIQLGANVNIHNTYDGSSAIMYSVNVRNIEDDELKYLKLLLEQGADPNDIEVGERKESNTTRDTPLMIACGRNKQAINPLPLVKKLVESGADVNKGDEFGRTPIGESFFQDNFEVLIYLLHEGANHRVPIVTDPKGQKFYLEHMLRRELPPIDSREYEQKKELVKFLESEGISYSEIPVPQYIIEKAKKLYPQSWKEYLMKY